MRGTVLKRLFGAAQGARRPESGILRNLLGRRASRHPGRLPRDVVDSIPDGLIAVDRHGTIEAFNAAAERIFGYTREEILGRPLRLLLADAPAPSNVDAGSALSWLIARGTPVEGVGRRQDGTHLPIELSLAETTTGGGATFLLMVRDVRARKAREEAGRARFDHVLSAIEGLPQGFAVFDADDRLVLCNTRLHEIYRPLAELLVPGSKYASIVAAQARTGLVAGATGREHEWERERLKRHATGPFVLEEELSVGRWYRVAEYSLGDAGTLQLITEVTKARQRELRLRLAKEEADQASRAKSEFLANMSHEVRTPLNAILGFSELMHAEMFGPLGDRRYTGYVGDIYNSAAHLLTIINDILDIARIEARKLELTEEPVRLKEVVDSSLTLLRQRAEDGAIDLVAQIDPELPPLFADRRLVKQIVSNLVSNAVRFTPPHGHVTVSVHLNDDGGCRIVVEDTGIGIAPDDLRRVVEPFEQAAGNAARRDDGTGLGLPLVKHFTELHGGRFRIASRTGEGTTAVVDFPPDRTIFQTVRATS